MRSFVQYILILLLITLGFMMIFDIAYTWVYRNGTMRNKVMWIRNSPPDTLDYAVFGSSRAYYTIDPVLIRNKTGAMGLNFGINSSGPLEIRLAVTDFLKHHQVDRIFVQVDHLYGLMEPVPEGSALWMPYLKEAHVYEVFEPFGPPYWFYRYVPFYRYLKHENSLGIRNVALALSGKQPDFLVSRGFKGTSGMIDSSKSFEGTMDLSTVNPHVEAITDICKANGVEAVYFTAPVFNARHNLSVLKDRLPVYIDFSDSLQRPELFRDVTHLNVEGAKAFTQIFIERFFKQQKSAP